MAGDSQVRFGPFSLQPAEYRLLRDGEPVRLTRKALDLLALLVGRPGELITKASLFETVWAGRVVSDAALSRVIHELRRALSDQADAPRYIATVHGLGFRFVCEVTVGVPGAPRAPDDADQSAVLVPAAPNIVGRESELAFLASRYRRAAEGARQVVFVTGEAGIGKTALMQTFVARMARSERVIVVQGRCIEQYGNAEAYLPFLEVLEQLARQVGNDVLAGVLARFAPAWLALLPWLAQGADPPLHLPGRSEVTAQRMLREIAQALEELAGRLPIVVWLEDLHWSDPSSLALIALLASRDGPARMMFVGTFRPSDALADESPLHGLALRLGQRGQAHSLALAALTVTDLADYLGLRFAPGRGTTSIPIAALAEFVHRRTDGNPLFAISVVDDLVARARLVRNDGDWRLDGGLAGLGDGLPEDLRRLVNEQFGRLGPSDRRVLEAASVAGAEFSAASVAVALGAGIAETEERCAALAEQGRFLCARHVSVWPDGTASAGFGFRHAVYWQAIHDRVPPTRRVEWHQRIGLRLEQAHAGEPASVAVELAMRFEATGDSERCQHYLLVAGTAALARCAYPESVALLERGLTLLPQLAAERRPRRELDLLLPLGAARMAIEGYAADVVDMTYRRALELCEVCGTSADVERVMRGQWNVAFLRADLSAARTIAEGLQRLANAGVDEGPRFDADTKVGQTCVHLPDLATARVNLERALQLASSSKKAALLRGRPRAAIYLAWVHWYSGSAVRALACADDALLFSRLAGSPHSTVFALGYASWLHSLRGDAPRARALAFEQVELSTVHGLAYWRALGAFNAAHADACLGAEAAGIDGIRHAIADMRAGGALVGIPYLLCRLAALELRVDQVDAARVSLAGAAAMAGNGNALYAAEALRLEGEVALRVHPGARGRSIARSRFDAAMSVAVRQGTITHELRAATSLARLLAGDGAVPHAVGVLAPCLGQMDAGADTEDQREARTLLQRWRA